MFLAGIWDMAGREYSEADGAHYGRCSHSNVRFAMAPYTPKVIRLLTDIKRRQEPLGDLSVGVGSHGRGWKLSGRH